MFCEHQEQIIVSNGYDNNDKIIITCNAMGKDCPYGKLKKAQKRCSMLKPIKEIEND